MILILAGETTANQRYAYFHLVDETDGITPETGEAGGQPQVSSNGGAFTNTGIGGLVHMGNGRYYAEMTTTLVTTAGTIIETRYKSANTAESPGTSIQVVAFDPNDTVRLGLTALPNAVADAAGGLPISDAGGLDMDSLSSSTISVTLPTLADYSPNRIPPANSLEMFGADAKTFVLSVVDNDNTAVDMSAMTLEFICETAHGTPARVFTIAAGAITVSGAGSDTATITVAASSTAADLDTIKHSWRLRDTVSDDTLMRGDLYVYRAASA